MIGHISEILEGVHTVGIAGHVHPDGDCIGSCMGLYLYLKKNYPQLAVDVYLEEPAPIFSFIEGVEEIHTEPGEEKIYDLFISCDASSMDRIGVALTHFEHAKKTVCIDHHISNTNFAMQNHVCGQIGSASEVLYSLLDAEKIDKAIAEALYTGMVHDTGVFQYTSTSPETMRIAGELMKTGLDFNKIIEESFYQKTFLQIKAQGYVLAKSRLFCNGAIITGVIGLKEMEEIGVTTRDLDSIVSQLRQVKGTEAALFLYETEPDVFKASLRSNGNLDMSKVVVAHNGGGHAKAAGCTVEGPAEAVLEQLVSELAAMLPVSGKKGE